MPILPDWRLPLAGGNSLETLFHLTTQECWWAAHDSDVYRWSTRGKTLDEVGFIHCSFAHQVERVADFVYAGFASVLLLIIDPSLVTAEIRVENLDGGDDLFPHIYGPLPVHAVVDSIALHANAAGRFHLSAR